MIAQEKLKSWVSHLLMPRLGFFPWEHWMLKSTGIFSSRWQTRKHIHFLFLLKPYLNNTVEIPKLINQSKPRHFGSHPPQKDFNTFREGKQWNGGARNKIMKKRLTLSKVCTKPVSFCWALVIVKGRGKKRGWKQGDKSHFRKNKRSFNELQGTLSLLPY